jgi:hypothetical protein
MSEKKKPVSGNPMQVEWPRDQYQLTQNFKAAGLRTSSRVGTQKDKLLVFLETLDVLREHAIEAFKKRKGIEASTIKAAQARAEAEAKTNEDRRLAQVATLKAQLAALEVETEDKPEEA